MVMMQVGGGTLARFFALVVLAFGLLGVSLLLLYLRVNNEQNNINRKADVNEDLTHF